MEFSLIILYSAHYDTCIYIASRFGYLLYLNLKRIIMLFCTNVSGSWTATVIDVTFQPT